MAQNAHEWPMYSSDAGGTKFSRLTQISPANVESLQLAWTWRVGEEPLPQFGTFPGKFQATPIMIDNVLYLSTPYNRVIALDPVTGREIWTYDPKAYEAGPGPPGVDFGKHRGVATWTDGTARRIFINTRWRLIALDAKTGKPVPTFGKEGEVDLTTDLSWEVKDKTHYMNTSPPVVYKGIVIVGSAISDRLLYPKSPPGDVQAFDAETGKRLWIFHTVPQKGEFGNETWEEGAAGVTGHTNVWVPITMDEKRGLLYLAVSTPSSDYYGGGRKGDNLFGDSLVCLDALTGRRVWHFQTVHHGLWDYDGLQTPNVLTITVDGKPIDVVAAVAKTGFTYVFDRVTGTPVWPIEERPVPQSDVPGEKTAPTQPMPVKPPPFVKQGMTEDDVVDFTPEMKAEALAKLRRYRFGPMFTPPSLQGTVLMPSNGGGANWGAASVDPEHGILYVKGNNWPRLITLTKPAPGAPPDPNYPDDGLGPPYRWTSPLPITITGDIPINKPPYATLTAIDLNKGDILWQVPLGDLAHVRRHPVLKNMNLPPLGGAFGNAGSLVTASGLLFISAGDRKLDAIDRATGKTLWAGELPSTGEGSPMTYQTSDGRQLIVVATGGGAEAALVGFTLPPAP